MSLKKSDGEGSATAQTYELLREDIVSCRLQPDERVRLEEFRERYSVGASSLREALMRLEAEGLVLLEPNKGFRVLPISREHLLDVMRARSEIDTLCLRWSLERGGVEWESTLVGSLHRLKRLSKRDGASDAAQNNWRVAHRAFHYALIEACGSATFTSFHCMLAVHVERYVSISVGIENLPRDDMSEHEEIVRAALERNSEEAVELLRGHFAKTSDKLVSTLFGTHFAAVGSLASG